MKTDVLLQCMEQEGISQMILAGALGLTQAALRKKLSGDVPFEPDEEAVATRLLGMTEQEAQYVFHAE